MAVSNVLERTADEVEIEKGVGCNFSPGYPGKIAADPFPSDPFV
jgi:hypothetical protein